MIRQLRTYEIWGRESAVELETGSLDLIGTPRGNGENQWIFIDEKE